MGSFLFMGFLKEFIKKHRKSTNNPTENQHGGEDTVIDELELIRQKELEKKKKAEKLEKLSSTPVDDVSHYIVELGAYRCPFVYKGNTLHYNKIAYYLLAKPIKSFHINYKIDAIEISGEHFGDSTLVYKKPDTIFADNIYTIDHNGTRLDTELNLLDSTFGTTQTNKFAIFQEPQCSTIKTIADIRKYVDAVNATRKQKVIDAFELNLHQQQTINELF